MDKHDSKHLIATDGLPLSRVDAMVDTLVADLRLTFTAPEHEACFRDDFIEMLEHFTGTAVVNDEDEGVTA